MSRKSARETLFKLVFEYCITNDNNKFSFTALTDGMNEDDFGYVSQTFEGIIQQYNFLTEKISAYSNEFVFERIYKIDLALLLVAVYEIYFLDSIPDSVSANEATELSRTYSTDKSYSFVNGILASIIKEKNNNVGKNN